MPITIACRACHSPLLMRPENLGHAVRCPSCGSEFVASKADVLIADKSQGGAATGTARSTTSQQSVPQRRARSRSTPAPHVVCPACQEPMLDDGSLAGQMVQCVRCGEGFRMPGLSSGTRASRARIGRAFRTQASSQGWQNYLFVGGFFALIALVLTVVLAIQQRVTQRHVVEQPPENASDAPSSANVAPNPPPPEEPSQAVAAVPPAVQPLNLPPPETSSQESDQLSQRVAVAVPADSSAKVSQGDRPAADDTSDVAGKPGTVKEIVDRVDPSIVRISIPGIGLGSGFVVDDNGTIITNYHVVAGATRATVVFSDKTELEATGFTAVIPDMDLAALQVVPRRPLRGLPLAKHRPAKGEQVLAFGAPQGLSFSVSDGIVSAVRPAAEVQEILKETSGRDAYRAELGYSLDMTWIQTSTPISPGNSGGPLVNLAGEVVGINTWSRKGENLNFAISAEHVATLLRQASGSPQPFSRLPKPRVEVVRISQSQIERTQEYWNKIYDAHQEFLTSAKKEKKKSSDGAKWLASAGRLRRFAVTIKKIDVRGVDLDLVLLTTELAQNVEEVAAALEDGANALPKGKLDGRSARSFDYRRAYSRYQAATASNRRICQRFDYLRVGFAAVYGVDFRVIFDLEAEDQEGMTDNK